MNAASPQCPHATELALRYAPTACHECHGWVQADRTIISTEDMLRRYPLMAQIVAQEPRQQMPDYQPTVGDKLLYANQLVGALARVLLMIVFLGALLVIIVVVVTHGH